MARKQAHTSLADRLLTFAPLHMKLERHSAALHRYAPLLFVLPAVEVSDLPGHPCGYDVVRCEKRIHHGSLPVVDMADCRYVAHVDSLCGGHCEDQKMGRDG